jgi:hypothetical protein
MPRRRGGFLSVKRRLSAAKHFAKRHSRKALGLAALGAMAYYGQKHKQQAMNDHSALLKNKLRSQMIDPGSYQV